MTSLEITSVTDDQPSATVLSRTWTCG